MKESVTFEDDALIIIAREAKGSLRDSLSLLEQTIAFCGGSGFSKHISVNDVKKSLCLQGEEVAENIFAAICEKNAGKALEFLHQADLASLDLAQLIENCAQLFRQSLLIKTISEKEKVLKITQLLPKEYDFLHKVTLNLTSTALSEIFRLLANSVKEISRTSAGLSVAEIIVIDCISRADWLSSTEILSFFSQRGNDVASRKPALDEAGGATCTLARSASTAKTVEVSTGDVATKSVQVFEKLKIDLNAFKKLIAAAEKRSQTLAARLNFAKIDFFNKDLIQFSDVSENETYLSLNEKDLSLYWECIHEIKMEHAQFKGVFTPKTSLKTNPASQSVSANIKNMIESAQKFAPKARNDVAQKQDISLETGKISLSDIKNKEKNQEFEEKEKSILGKEHIKQVQKLATEIQLIALK